MLKEDSNIELSDPNGDRTRDPGVAFRCLTIFMYTIV